MSLHVHVDQSPSQAQQREQVRKTVRILSTKEAKIIALNANPEKVWILTVGCQEVQLKTAGLISRQQK